jgi:uncharacterized membrane protein YeaQ/YmgE (transglycosylase-associated protein family)
MTSLIGYAIFGLVAGAIARMLHPGRDPMNWLWTMVLGIAGAEIGGFAARQLGYDTSGGVASWVTAVVGAIVLLAVYHMATAPRAGVAGPGGTGTGTATNDDYKRAVYDDLSRGPNG